MAMFSKKFAQSLSIKQVGAAPIKTRRGTLFKLGGGVFTKRQIVASRRRFSRTFLPKFKKGHSKKLYGL